MTDAKEPILLKVIAPPSHTALSGDVTVLILDSAETESSTVATSIATTVTDDTRKDEKKKIDPKEGRVAVAHEPLVLRYVEKTINTNTHMASRHP